ncbi:MAG: ketosteroid isomerase [Bacteroidetes bacterium]|nr:ketosteroid isomerase [Bacteroidota bacterium]
MNEHHRNIIGKAYQSYNNRDINSILLFMHQNVSWPNGWEGGNIEGHAELRDYWTRQWKKINPSVKPLSIKENSKGQVEVMVHQISKDLEGKIITDGIVKHIYMFEEGLIKRMDIHKP